MSVYLVTTYYKFSTGCAGEKILKICPIWQRYGQKFVAYTFLAHPVIIRRTILPISRVGLSADCEDQQIWCFVSDWLLHSHVSYKHFSNI